MPTPAQLDAEIAAAEKALKDLQGLKDSLPAPAVAVVDRAEAQVTREIHMVVQSPRFTWAARAARTAIQLLASGALMAAVRGIVGPFLPPTDLVALAAAVTPFASAAQTFLEDKGVIGRLLSSPPLAPTIMLLPIKPDSTAWNAPSASPTP